MKEELVVACINTLTVWNYCTEETAQKTIEGGTQYYKDCLEQALERSLNPDYDTEYWKERAEELSKIKLEVMTEKEYWEAHNNFYLCKPVEEITEEKFYEMLECLPPMLWETHNGCNEFCMSEMYSGNISQQFGRKQGKYFTKFVNVGDRSTWLHNFV